MDSSTAHSKLPVDAGDTDKRRREDGAKRYTNVITHVVAALNAELEKYKMFTTSPEFLSHASVVRGAKLGLKLKPELNDPLKALALIDSDLSVMNAVLEATKAKDVTAILTHGTSLFVAHLLSRPAMESVAEAVVDVNWLQVASTFTTFRKREGDARLN
jgi:hypothetical protein